MTKHLTLLIFIFSSFWSCASTSDDALRQQENFIKNHPTWEGHPLNFEKRKPELNALEIIEKYKKNLLINFLHHGFYFLIINFLRLIGIISIKYSFT